MEGMETQKKRSEISYFWIFMSDLVFFWNFCDGLEVANIDVLSTRHFHDSIVVFLLFIIALSLAASSLLSKQFVLN